MTGGWRFGYLLVVASLAMGLSAAGAINNRAQDSRLDYLESVSVQQQDDITDVQTQNRRYAEAIQELLKQQSESTARIVLPTSTCTLHDIFEQTAGC